jgi:uncharacterized membrane protein YhaH (DUF805 family)
MEYWMFTVINFADLALLLIIGYVFGDRVDWPGTTPLIIYWLATVIPHLAVAVRRLHDVNMSGAWLLIDLIPFGVIVLLILQAMDGTPGPNRYGPDPKERAIPTDPSYPAVSPFPPLPPG